MEEFHPTENTLAKWKVNKTTHRMLGTIVFLIPLSIFIVSFLGIYVLLQSTNIALLILPFVLFLPVIPAAKEFWDVFKIYQENTEIYLTDNGVYVRYVDRSDKYDFISWYSIKQYDVVPLPKHVLLDRIAGSVTRFVLRGEIESENIAVDAVGSNADILTDYLNERNVPFGFKTD